MASAVAPVIWQYPVEHLHEASSPVDAVTAADRPPGVDLFRRVLDTPIAQATQATQTTQVPHVTPVKQVTQVSPITSDDLAQPEGPPGVPFFGLTHKASPAVTPTTAGDALLNSLGALSSEMQRAWQGLWTSASALQGRGVGAAGAEAGLPTGVAPDGAESADAPGLPSISQIIGIQVGLVEVSVMLEIAGKGTSKAIQNLNEMVKMQ
jgi:hypothetical protein